MTEPLKRIRKWMQDNCYEAVILSRRDNYTWISGGSKNHVLTTTEVGVASYVVWQDHVELIADSSDLARMAQEQNALRAETTLVPWYESLETYMAHRVRGANIVSDTGIVGTINVQGDLVELRMKLTEKERILYKNIGMECAEIVEKICVNAQPGQTEMDIANQLQSICVSRGISPDCVLVGSDERILNYRHPMPTDKVICHSLMVVLGGEKGGLNISMTRMVYFGTIPEDIVKKYGKVQAIFAEMQMMMKEGLAYREYFKQVQALYKKAGFADEWKLHHQGGPTGYGCRELIAGPDCSGTIHTGQAYAWNPTITGTKCEETTYLGEEGIETFTRTKNWPCSRIETSSGMFQVADIWER